MKKIQSVLLLGLFLCMASCEKELPPSLSALTIDAVTDNAVTCRCDVTGGTMADAAFFYGTSKTTVQNMRSDKKQVLLNGTTMQTEISGLKPNTTYYIMGYGMNEKGQSLTEMVEVKTLSRIPQANDNLHPGTTE